MYFEDLIESKETVSKQATFEKMISPITPLLANLQEQTKLADEPFTQQLSIISELTRQLLRKILFLSSEPVPIQTLLKEIIKIKNLLIAYDKQVTSSQRLTTLNNALNTLMQNLLASEPRPLFPIKPIINPSPHSASPRKELSPRVPSQQIKQPNNKLEKIEEEKETFGLWAKRKWNSAGKQLRQSLKRLKNFLFSSNQDGNALPEPNQSSCFRSSCSAILSCLKCFIPSSQPAEAIPERKRYCTSPAQARYQSLYAEEEQNALIEDQEPLLPSAKRIKK